MKNENHFSQRLLKAAAEVKDAIDLKFSFVTGTAQQQDNGKISFDQDDPPKWKNAKTFARELKVNRNELERAFKHRNKGKGINKYQTDKKIEAAGILLTNGDLTIKEIAVELNYNQDYFSCFFKKKKGMTPTEWQKKYGNGSQT